MAIELIWPEKQTKDLLDYTYDVTADVEPGDSIVYLVAETRPSGQGELALDAVHPLDITLGGGGANTLITVWLKDGIGARGYLVRLLVTMASGRRFDILATLLMSRVLQPYPFVEPPSTDFSVPMTWSPGFIYAGSQIGAQVTVTCNTTVIPAALPLLVAAL